MNDNSILSAVLAVAIGCAVLGCSSDSEGEVVNRDSDRGVVDGGTVANIDRDKAQEYFDSLAKVESAEEEAKLLTEFADWLNDNEYKIEVEEKDGKHMLSCPYFPPVTPWMNHTFIDVANLDILPRS